MIKIKDVINRLQLYADGNGNKTLSPKVANEAIQTIRELQEQIPKWHRVEDELPSEDREV